MSKTYDDLQAGFAGESQANRKYLAYAEKADKDGYPQAAKLFRAAAAAETVHAHNHFRAMGMVKTTQENLKDAIGGEHYEVTTMYPDFIEDAQAENENKQALRSFEWALAVEKTHEALYTEMLENLEELQKDLVDYYVCSVCGHTHVGGAPDECPVCGAKKEKFFLVD
ncbi:MAG: rubrerythrin family protein [Anaerolineae bacterium]|nr:rubrerythrin family protein [Anaerolineae bacterium]